MCDTAERHASIQTTGNVYMQEIPDKWEDSA